ncbi:VOC family protein [Parafrankia sp. FMc2]|uniref:VOC family protein n=1 Tax=Parafrankia sp. FMc2 TaxID=3233196 RepID=UPI003B58A1B5
MTVSDHVDALPVVRPPIVTKALDHIVLNVEDPERSVQWWVDNFGMRTHRLQAWREGRAPFPSVEVAPGVIIDLDARTPRGGPGHNVNHFCVVIEPCDLTELAASGVFDVVGGPFHRYGAHGNSDLLYIRDPDGNVVELRHYGPSQLDGPC